MKRIEDGMEELGVRLKEAPKNKQSKAFIRILQFFAVMLALTLFARGAAAVSMPQVTTAYLGSGTISKTEKFTGTVMAAGQETVKVPAGLKVEKVHVTPGNTVKKGDDLVTFDAATAQKALNTQSVTLKDLEVQLAELKKTYKQDDSALDTAQKAQTDAQTALDEANTASSEAVVAAQQTLDDARATLDAAKREKKTAEEALKKAKKKDPPPADDELAALEANVAAAETRIAEGEGAVHTAEEALATAQKQASKDVTGAQTALNDANSALGDAQQEYNENKPVFTAESQKRQLEIVQKQQELETQQETIDKLQALVSLGGVITAPLDGRVAEVTLAADGAETAETDSIRIATATEGYYVEFPVEKDKVQQIKMGSVVSVQRENDYWGSEARVTGRSIADETGNITMKAQISSTEWTDGDSVNVVVTLSDKQYWNTVPVAAVRPDAEGHYVFVVSEENTILGKQSIARKVPVTVQDQNNELAAIEGVYEGDARIVVSGSKPVHDGDMVRLDEASSQ